MALGTSPMISLALPSRRLFYSLVVNPGSGLDVVNPLDRAAQAERKYHPKYLCKGTYSKMVITTHNSLHYLQGGCQDQQKVDS